MLIKFLSLALASVCLFPAAHLPATTAQADSDFIKWVDCAASTQAMTAALEMCREELARGKSPDFSGIIAYTALRNGNRFGRGDKAVLSALKDKLKEGETPDGLVGDNAYYRTLKRSYAAIFDGIVGVKADGKFDIIGYFPLAEGHWYGHYDDFGNARSYGFKRKHLGHDINGSVGAPIVAVEGGTVTEIGWNRYGGWRVGIRSYDGLRYWYYAHLRRNAPFARGLEKGSTVTAGQHIGYLGHTGYSTKENTDLKTGSPHLHIGLQLIFDPSQEKGAREIWVDLYALTSFLSRNRARLVKTTDGDYVRE